MSGKPEITVLLSVYEAELFLREAVDSVLVQTLSDFEFLIFEDCSKDRSREILQSYSDSRIRLVLNDENTGLTTNLVRGMEMARGKYVARMDADDVCLPERFAKQLAFLESNPSVGLLGTAVDFFDENGSKGIAYQPVDHEEIKCALFLGYTLFHPSVMMRLEAFRTNGLNYDPTFKVSQDHDLWERAVRCFKCANLSEPLLRMREHGSKIGSTRKGTQEEFSNLVRKRQLDELGVVYTAKELNAFNWGASPCGFPTGVLKAYDEIGMKILASNDREQVLDQATLQRSISRHFRSLCRAALLTKTKAGRYYWRSKLRGVDEPSLRDLIGLGIRTIQC